MRPFRASIALVIAISGGVLTNASTAAPPNDRQNPLQPIRRVWTDISGTRQQLATLVEVQGQIARFLLPAGGYASTSLNQLSANDRALVRAFGRIPAIAFSEAQASSEAAVPDREPSRQSDESVKRETAGGLSAFGIADLGALSILGNQTSDELPARLMVVLVSPRFFEHYFRPDVDETRPVQDVILGTTFRGTSRTTGLRAISLVPDKDQASVDLLFTGTSISATSGGDTVVIRSRATTHLEASKRVTLSEAGITFLPTKTTAECASENTGYFTELPGLRGRIAKRIATSTSDQTRSQANEQSARHSEQSTNREIDRSVANSLAWMDEGIRHLLTAGRESELNLRMRSSTTTDQMRFVFYRDLPDGLPAEAVPAAIHGNPAMAVWIHSSLVIRMLTDPKLRQQLQPLLAAVGPENASTAAGTDDAASRISPPTYKVGRTEDGKWLTLSLDFPVGSSADDHSESVAASK